jgi:hypothetical protein
LLTAEFNKAYYEARRKANEALAAQAALPELRQLHIRLAQYYSQAGAIAEAVGATIDWSAHGGRGSSIRGAAEM